MLIKNVMIAALTVLAIAATVMIVYPGAASGQPLCVAQISSPYMTTTLNPYSNIQLTMPISVTCTFTRGQLYAVGDAFDNSTNVPLGSVLGTLPSVNKGNQFNGQLVFIIPAADRGHSIYFAVSIYYDPPNTWANFSNSQELIANAQLLATTNAQVLVLPEFPVSTVVVIIAVLFVALATSKRRH